MSTPTPKPAASPTGFELVGLISVATVLVDGPADTPEAFTDAQRSTVLTAVANAEQQLGAVAEKYSPGRRKLCWFFNSVHTVVYTPPAGTISEPTDTRNDRAAFENEVASLEGVWLPPAMTAVFTSIGRTPSTAAGAPDAVTQFCDYLIGLPAWPFSFMPRRAIVLFFTKFPTGWMAYGHGLVSNYSVFQIDWLASTSPFLATGASGWGTENLDRVVAHEMGHLFGGMDEYDGCNIRDVSGPDNDANTNCVKLADGTVNASSVDCLMKDITRDALCPATPGHFGWLDDDRDGLVDAERPIAATLLTGSGKSGDNIQVIGRFLGDTVSVTFVGVGPATFIIRSDNDLDVTVPPPPAGITTVDVVVRTLLAESLKSATMKFSYNP